MTAIQITTYAAILVSLLFSYIPGLNDWFAIQTATKKRLVMLGVMLIVTLGAFGLSCTPLVVSLHLAVSCTAAGAYDLVPSFVAAVIASQAAFAISPQRARYAMLKEDKGV